MSLFLVALYATALGAALGASCLTAYLATGRQFSCLHDAGRSFAALTLLSGALGAGALLA